MRTRRTAVVAIMSACASLVAGCVDEAPAEELGDSAQPLDTPRLRPPRPFVMAPDGVTRRSLEQAGIYRPGGDRWAVVLGKALFWDEQVGSHGVACASCHFVAGADTRLRNQVTPGFTDISHGPGGDATFGSVRSDTGAVAAGRMPSGAVPDATYRLAPADFPLHHLVDKTDRDSAIVTTTNDRISSQGAFAAKFRHVLPLGLDDACSRADASVFHAGPFAARQVEPRNTPSFHNAAFNFRNFWDNRANNLFNGVGVFGLRDVVGPPEHPDDPRNNNRIVVADPHGPRLDYLQVENASLASQAVGPPTSDREMSCAGRTFPDIGRKLLWTIPLLRQRIAPSDSVLGPFAAPWGGMRFPYSYALLITQTFPPKYWALPGRYRITGGRLVADPSGYTQMELNFSMFWGLAIAAYESTTISDQSELDSLQAAGRLVMAPSFAPAGPGIGACTSPTGDVDPLLLRGCTIFARFNPSPFVPTPPDGVRGGNCFVCHDGTAGAPVQGPQPLLSEGSFQDGAAFPLFLTVADQNNVIDLRDAGSANIGLRDAVSDPMSGGVDPYGNPLSFARQYWSHLDGQPDAILDPPLARLLAANGAPARGLPDDPPAPPGAFLKLEADGSAKAPILRNVALTPPYFSWGGYADLRQLLEVYNRGMNRRAIRAAGGFEAHGSACAGGDDSGSGPDGDRPWPIQDADCNTNTTGLIIPLGLLDCDADGAGCAQRGLTPATDDLAALARFLAALTDRRVQCDRAPFDHPELHVVDGQRPTDRDRDGRADDIVFTLPAVGAAGYAPASGFCIPNAGDLFAPGMQARAGGLRVPLAP